MDLRRDPHLDPAKLLELHDALFASAQDDARVRQSWQESNSAYRRRLREELREAWREHHSCMQALHAQLAAEHERKAAALASLVPEAAP